MADPDLIDNLVDDAALGIKKKPSLLKIASIVLFISIVAFLAFSILMKAKAEPAKPALVLGPALNNLPEQIGHTDASAVQPTPAVQTVPVTQTQVTQQPVQSASNVAPISTATPASSIQTQMPVTQPQIAVQPQVAVITKAIESTPTVAKVQQPVVADKPKEKKTSNVTPAPQKKEDAAQAFLESTQSEPEAKPAQEKVVVVKKAHKKVAKKTEEKVVKTEEKQTPAIPMEEGVTREEIIVIQ